MKQKDCISYSPQMYFIQININAFPRFKKTKQHYFSLILLFELIALALNIKMKFIEDYSCSKKFLLIFESNAFIGKQYWQMCTS